jgi:predicted small lipoprotein YifL
MLRDIAALVGAIAQTARSTTLPIALAVGLLAACGIKGPLRLPTPPAPAVSVPDAAATPPQAIPAPAAGPEASTPERKP